MSEVALVTGASSGIGAEFAGQLSQRGYEVVLVARREERMRELASRHAFLPGMLERRRGGVLTVASTAGMQPIPYEAVYSASKAFARTFSDALSAELRGTGVRALCVNPGPVLTECQQVAGYEPGYLPPVPGKISAAQVAAESLRAFERGRRSLIPGPLIRWYMRIDAPAPLPIKLRVVERMYRPADGASSDRG